MISSPRQPERSRLCLSLMIAILPVVLLAAGCRANADLPSGVPEGAKLITERSGGLAFSVPDAGSVYIYDEDRDRIIFRSPVRFRDKLIFYPQKDRIILNGNVVKEDRNLDEEHVHRLYFVKG